MEVGRDELIFVLQGVSLPIEQTTAGEVLEEVSGGDGLHFPVKFVHQDPGFIIENDVIGEGMSGYSFILVQRRKVFFCFIIFGG